MEAKGKTRTVKTSGIDRRRARPNGIMAFRIVAVVLLISIALPTVWCQAPGSADDAQRVRELETQLNQAQKDLERNLRAYLFPAFLIVWLALFGYMRVVDKKQRALEETLRDMRTRLESRQ